MKRSAFAALLTTLATLCACSDAMSPGATTTTTTTTTTPPPTPFTVAFTGGTITAAIASTSQARSTGLMNRTSMAADSGMLFVFVSDQPVPPSPLPVGFYMQNTLIDLSIAFFDSTKVVISTDEMQANTLTPHYPPRAYRYALEANKAWFTSHGVSAGAQATFTLPAGTIVTP